MVENKMNFSTGRFAALAFLLGIVPQAITEAAITSSLPEIARDMGENGEFVAQMLMLTGMLGLVFGALFSGKILEVLGSRSTYLIASLVFATAGAAGLYVFNTPLLFISRIITGFAASCIATTAMWGVAAQFNREDRPKSFGFAGAIGGSLAIVSVICGGILTESFGWRAAFLQFAIVGLFLLPIAFGGVVQNKPSGIQKGQKGHFVRLLPIYIQCFLIFAVIGVFSVQLSFLADRAGLTNAGMRSLVQAIPGMGVIVGGSLFGFFIARIGVKKTFILNAVSICVACAIVAFNQSVTALAIAAACTGLCMGLSMPWFFNRISEKTEPQMVGRYMGYMTAFTFMGSFSNPFWAQPIKGEFGVSGLFLVSAAIAGIALIYALYSFKSGVLDKQ